MFTDNIKKLSEGNLNFRTVLYTGQFSQVVAMSIPVGEDLGVEVHPNTDQIIYIVNGHAEAQLNNQLSQLNEDQMVFVTAGSVHNIKNVGDEELKLFTIYSPPHHPDGTVHVTKQEAKEAK